MKKTKLIIMLAGVLFVLTGCDSLRFAEYDRIQYNNIEYVEERLIAEYDGYAEYEKYWVPKTKLKNEKIKVDVIGYDGHKRNGKYYGNTYESDEEKIFIYFNNQVYFEENYEFPNLESSDTVIEKIILHSEDGKNELLIADEYGIRLFMDEY